ncbi:MAG: class I SAM-dependent methyltransferase [Candidatus Electrothrix sp. MAN1_4]|nr:class I SAM-dependent methyltransferase [Candidatus Electrothrix sp. MAN1_4]
MKLESGIPKIENYQKVLKSELFLEMENFSNSFLHDNSRFLSTYNRKWVVNPLHQWSRRWEYPYVYSMIEQYFAYRPESECHILDAGSGVTFFPYYLVSQFKNIEVIACDYDASFKAIINNISSASKKTVNFLKTNLQEIPLEDESVDVIYCVSVLEHTNNFELIIKEFKRVLKPTGIFILTFDISLDGISEISPSIAEELLQTLVKYFKPFNAIGNQPLIEAVKNPNILTTHYIRQLNKDCLPWKYPLLSTLKSAFIKRRFPKSLMKNLTFYCQSFEVK